MRLGIEYIINNTTGMPIPTIKVFFESDFERSNPIKEQVEKILSECLFLLKTSPEGLIKE